MLIRVETFHSTITAVIVTETDVIVHVKTSDGEDINTTMFHPFYVRHTDQESGGSVYDGEWKVASNLLAGDVLQKIDGSTVYVTEVTVEKLPEIINVYNLEIEDLHTYYVADGVLVHNECKKSDKSQNVDEGGSKDGIDVDNLNFSNTVSGHGNRPYQDSKLLINEIINSSEPIQDPQGTNALYWEVDGSFNNSNGIYELLIDPETNTVWHFVYKSK